MSDCLHHPKKCTTFAHLEQQPPNSIIREDEHSTAVKIVEGPDCSQHENIEHHFHNKLYDNRIEHFLVLKKEHFPEL